MPPRGGHGGFDDPRFPLNWQPMYPGLAAAAVVYGAGLLRPQPFATFRLPDVP